MNQSFKISNLKSNTVTIPGNSEDKERVSIFLGIEKIDNSKFSLINSVKISNTDNLECDKKWVKIAKNSKKPFKPINSPQKGYNVGGRFKNIDSFQIKITADSHGILEEKEIVLSISFQEEGQAETSIDFTVYFETEKFEISKFEANQNILQINQFDLQLSWEIKGSPDEIEIYRNNTLLSAGKACNGNHFIKLSQDIDYEGDYEYTLKIKKGEQVQAKSIHVLVLEDSTIKRKLPAHNWQIVNFCVGQKGEYLFALLYRKDAHDDQAYFAIGHTDKLYGQQWTLMNIKPEMITGIGIKSFITSPMIHLRDDSESYGRILFIGGSRLGKGDDDKKSGNQVLEIDLKEFNPDSDLKVSTYNTDNYWKYKYGHTCILFPDDESKEECIWLLGGMDKNSNFSTDVWKSKDGKVWKKVNQSGSTPTGRKMAGITVELDEDRNKKAIWYGGPSDSTRDSDIWKSEDGKVWKKIQFVGSEQLGNDLRCFGLGYNSRENAVETGLYVLGYDNTTKSKLFNSIDYNNDDEYEMSKDYLSLRAHVKSYNRATIITGFFKECMLFFTISSAGALGTDFSGLFYRIPVLQQITIDFYNKKKQENV